MEQEQGEVIHAYVDTLEDGSRKIAVYVAPGVTALAHGHGQLDEELLTAMYDAGNITALLALMGADADAEASAAQAEAQALMNSTAVGHA